MSRRTKIRASSNNLISRGKPTGQRDEALAKIRVGCERGRKTERSKRNSQRRASRIRKLERPRSSVRNAGTGQVTPGEIRSPTMRDGNVCVRAYVTRDSKTSRSATRQTTLGTRRRRHHHHRLTRRILRPDLVSNFFSIAERDTGAASARRWFLPRGQALATPPRLLQLGLQVRRAKKRRGERWRWSEREKDRPRLIISLLRRATVYAPD